MCYPLRRRNSWGSSLRAGGGWPAGGPGARPLLRARKVARIRAGVGHLLYLSLRSAKFALLGARVAA